MGDRRRDRGHRGLRFRSGMRPLSVLARKTLVQFLNTLIGGVFGLLALRLIAQYLGDVLLGQVAYAMGLMGLLRSVLSLQLGEAHVKRLSEDQQPGACMTTFFWAQTGLTVLFLGTVAALVGFRLFVQQQGFQSTTLLTLLVMAVYFTVRSYKTFATSSFQARREIARAQAVDTLDNFVRTFSAIGLAVVFAAVTRDAGPLAGFLGTQGGWIGAFGAELLALTYVLGALASVVASVVYLVKDYEFGAFDRELLGSYWDFAKPLMVAGLFSVAANRLDRVMIGFFWGSSQVGIYFGADRIVSLILTLGGAVGTLLLPTISYMNVEEDLLGIRDVTYRAIRYSTMVTIPVVLGAVVFAEPIIHLILSDAFLKGAPTLGVLAINALVSVGYRPYQSMLGGMDRSDLMGWATIVMAVTNVGLNFVLIPADIGVLGIDLFGLRAFGAAIATLASTVVGWAVFRVYAGRILDLRPQWASVLRQLVAGGVMVGALFWLDSMVVGLARWYHLGLFGLLGLGIYLGALTLVGGFDRDDLDFFLDMLHPEEMWDYLTDELFSRQREREDE